MVIYDRIGVERRAPRAIRVCVRVMTLYVSASVCMGKAVSQQMKFRDSNACPVQAAYYFRGPGDADGLCVRGEYGAAGIVNMQMT